MTDQELIQAAEEWWRDYYMIQRHDTLLADLASRLTALQAENAELRKEIERLQDPCGFIELLKMKIARVEAERDALLEYAETQMECEMCKNDSFCHVVNPMPENCAACELKPKCPCHPCKWEWSGAQGEV